MTDYATLCKNLRAGAGLDSQWDAAKAIEELQAALVSSRLELDQLREDYMRIDERESAAVRRLERADTEFVTLINAVTRLAQESINQRLRADRADARLVKINRNTK